MEKDITQIYELKHSASNTTAHNKVTISVISSVTLWPVNVKPDESAFGYDTNYTVFYCIKNST